MLTETLFAPPDVRRTLLPDGGFILSCPSPLAPYPRTLGDMLVRAAQTAPDRVFLAERAGDDWRRLSYADALATVRRIGEALLARAIPAGHSIAILAENGVDHALLALGAMQCGIPAVPISAAYARLATGLPKLTAITAQIAPALVFVDAPARLAAARHLAAPCGAELVTAWPEPGATHFDDLRAPPDRIDAVFAALTGDTVAKFLFTSGSTGAPKGVINTHRMLCANQQMIAQVWPFLSRRPPVILDWLPWSHTFGGNHDFNMILNHAGTLYIDAGKPAPNLFETTLRNLRSVQPTIMFNVPAGYAMLADALDSDPALARHFFAKLDLLFYAAAALPQSTWTRLENLSRAATGRVVPMVSSWGLTETAPSALSVYFHIERAGVIGLPLPGCEIKFAPAEEKYELRVRGPNVTPGYWNQPDKTAAAFDESGFYRTGDAARLADPENPAAGVIFDGRLAENFKLATGTWVNVGMLRVTLLAATAPLLSDIVVAGEGTDEICLLAFPAPNCDAAALAEKLRAHNESCQHASSLQVARVLLQTTPPALEHGEITDKGYINQRAVLNNRAADVARLYALTLDPAIIALEKTEG